MMPKSAPKILICHTILLSFIILNNIIFTPAYAFDFGKIDSYEPNNKLEKATTFPLNSSLAITIYPDGDRDFFALNIPEDGLLSLILDKGIYTQNFSFNLYKLPEKEPPLFIGNTPDKARPEYIYQLTKGKYILELAGPTTPLFMGISSYFSALSEESDIRPTLVGLGIKGNESLNQSLSDMANLVNGKYYSVQQDEKREIETVLYAAVRHSLKSFLSLPEISILFTSQLAEDFTSGLKNDHKSHSQIMEQRFEILKFVANKNITNKNKTPFEFSKILEEMTIPLIKDIKKNGGEE